MKNDHSDFTGAVYEAIKSVIDGWNKKNSTAYSYECGDTDDWGSTTDCVMCGDEIVMTVSH